MSLRQTNLLIFFSFFPVFVFKSNLVNAEIFSSIIVFTLPILLINIFFIKKNILNDSFLKIYYSLIIVFGIDNNIGLWNGVISPFKYFLMDIFNIIYIPGFILLIILTLFIFIVISRTDKKFYNVILIFLSVIFVFKIFDQTKSYKNIPSFVKKINNNYKKTELVIILDEMSGINSFESLSSDGIEFNILAKKFFKKYNFEFYTNAKTIEANTVSSLSALLNYSNTSKTRIETTNISTNYFIGYNLTESLFFKRFKNISIFQSEHLNFCNFENISKCDAYNPFNENEYLKGYKDTALTKIVSLWKINGSISSTFVWRLLRELKIIDSNLEPEGHKANFQHLFKKINEDINSQKFDLIFVHTLVPHKPYGFNKNCTYNGGLSTMNTYYSIAKHVEQHNLERKCVLIYLDKFLEKLTNNNKIDSINLTILSDHGSRIVREDSSSLSTIYAYRDNNTNYKEFEDKIYIQEIFSSKFN